MGEWVPVDIVSSFEGRIAVCRSLVVKGQRGAGKTTLAFELARQLGKEILYGKNYLDVGTSERGFANEYSERLKNLRPRDLGHRPENAPPIWKVPRTKLEDLEESVRAGRLGADLLHGIRWPEEDVEEYPLTGEPMPGTGIDPYGNCEVWRQRPAPPVEVKIEPVLLELRAFYKYVERCLLLPALLIVDPLDALADLYGVPASRLVLTLQRDLVDNGYANVIYVLEGRGESPVDRYVDGSVELVRDESSGSCRGILKIERLRGMDIRQSRYTYWVSAGRLTISRSDNDIVEDLLGVRKSTRRAGIPHEVIEFLEDPVPVSDPLVVR